MYVVMYMYVYTYIHVHTCLLQLTVVLLCYRYLYNTCHQIVVEAYFILACNLVSFFFLSAEFNLLSRPCVNLNLASVSVSS